MAVQFSVAVRNARQNAIETTVGTSPKLQLFTLSQPANCAASATGTLLCTLTLPSDWVGAASGGATAIAGTWTGTAIAAGTCGHYRIYDSAGTTCHEQGSVGIGTGDLQLDNTSIAVNQVISIPTWTTTDGNA
jgi:hypothetical protein